MAGLIDYGIVKPELAGAFGAGYRASGQERLQRQSDEQNMQMNQLRLDTGRAEFERLQQERRLMLDFQNKLKASGKDTNLETYFDHMVESGIPDYVEKGMMGKQKLNEQRQFARIMGFGDESSASAPRTNPLAVPPLAPASGGVTVGNPLAAPQAQPTPLGPMNAMVAPTPAPAVQPASVPVPNGSMMAPRPSANPVANQFGPDQVATVIDRIQRLTALGTPQAIQTAKILQDQLEMVARQKGEMTPKLSDRFVPVGKHVFDRQEQRWINGPASGPDTVVQVGTGAGTPPTKLKPGEVYNKDLDRIEAKPGSDLFVKQSKDHAKDYKAATSTSSMMDESIAKVDRILDPKNASAFEGNFGGYNAYASRMLPGENSNLRKDIDSFKSDLKRAGLELIRQGGSIGQMTEREWPIVEQMLASIDPVLGEEKAREVFGEIRNRFQRIKTAAADVYDTQWGQTQYHKGLNTKPAPQSAANARPDGVGADWTLMTDKAGNKAWVSPDRKSFKEVK